MNILHLLSNRKWTERAEPAVNLALAQRALGHTVLFACGRWTLPEGEERSVAAHAEKKGLQPVILELPKHFRLSAVLKDVPAIRHLVKEHGIAILHAHMENAHLLAALALRGASTTVRLIKQSYDAGGPPRGWRSSILHRRYTDGLMVLSEAARETAMSVFRLPAERVAVIEPGIDLDFFSPSGSRNEARRSLGISPDHFVAGMVTRIRSDRRPDLLVQALARLALSFPELRVLLVGRGEAAGEMAGMARTLGVDARLTMPGYLSGPGLRQAYEAMDILVYPVPGTDQSCRTVREAMAMGLPVIAGRHGFLPQLVEEKVTGWFMAESAESLAAVMESLYRRAAEVRALRPAVRRRAEVRFSLPLQAERSIEFYRNVIEAGARVVVSQKPDERGRSSLP